MFEKLQKNTTAKTKITIKNTVKIINIVEIVVKIVDTFVKNVNKKQLFAIIISSNNYC